MTINYERSQDDQAALYQSNIPDRAREQADRRTPSGGHNYRVRVQGGDRSRVGSVSRTKNQGEEMKPYKCVFEAVVVAACMLLAVVVIALAVMFRG